MDLESNEFLLVPNQSENDEYNVIWFYLTRLRKKKLYRNMLIRFVLGYVSQIHCCIIVYKQSNCFVNKCWKEYDRGDSFSFDYEHNGILFGS